jgi:hypothetical protein
MRVRWDAHQAWIRGQAVAVAWIGALIFPLILLMPVGSTMFWICLLLGVIVIWSLIESLCLAKQAPRSDLLAKVVVPVCLLLVSTCWVAWDYVAA